MYTPSECDGYAQVTQVARTIHNQLWAVCTELIVDVCVCFVTTRPTAKCCSRQRASLTKGFTERLYRQIQAQVDINPNATRLGAK